MTSLSLSRTARSRRNPIAHAVLLTLALAAGTAAPLAAQAQTAAPAAGAAVRQFQIPAGPMGPALTAFATEAGISISAPPALVRASRTAGLQGRFTVEEGLQRLLAGSALQARGAGQGSYVLWSVAEAGRPAAAGTAGTTMAEVRVTAEAERSAATEGTGAYTARESAASTGMGLSLRETPQSVTVFTRQRMDDQGIVLQEDIARQTTGLTYAQYGPTGGDTNFFFARGFQVKNFQVDGVNRLFSDYPGIFQTSDMALYDRAEIVRGATGLMSGAGTPGATINLVRKRPAADFQAGAKITAGSWDFGRAEADVSSALNESGSVRGRVVAVAQNRHSKVDYEQDRTRTLYGVVEMDLAPATLATVGFAAQDYDASGVGRSGRPLFYSDGTRTDWSRSASSGARWATTRRDYRSAFASIEHLLDSGWRLKAAYTRDQSSYDEIPGWTNENPVDRATGGGVGLWAAWWTGRPVQDSLDFTASGPISLLGRQHDAAFGASFARTRNDSQAHGRWSFDGWDGSIDNIYTWDGRTPVQPNNPALGDSGARESSNSAYGSLRLRPTDALSVILGARVTSWKRSDYYADYATGERSDSSMNESGKLTPYAGVVLDLTRDWSVYGSYTDIFQAQSATDINGRKLDPVLGRSYELGVKGELLERRLQLGAAAYRLLQDNVAVAVPGSYAPDGNQAYRAVKGAETRGVEFEASGALTPRWNLYAGFARNLARDAQQQRLNPEIPRNTFKLFTTYRLDGLGRGMTVGGGLRWQSATWSDVSFLGLAGVSRAEQPGYGVADLMVKLPLTDQLTLAANLYNVFDKKYQAISTSAYYGEARNLRVSLAMKF